jgi:hypothetical protein
VEMPEGERDRTFGIPDPVSRVEGEMIKRLDRMFEQVNVEDGCDDDK